jgi:hypothetical protein
MASAPPAQRHVEDRTCHEGGSKSGEGRVYFQGRVHGILAGVCVVVWMVRSPCVSASRLHAHQTQLQYQPGTSLAQDPLEGREAPLRKSHVARVSPFAVCWRVAKRQEYAVDVKKDNPERSPRRRRRSPSRHGGRGLSAGERAKPKQARCRRQAGAVEAFARSERKTSYSLELSGFNESTNGQFVDSTHHESEDV